MLEVFIPICPYPKRTGNFAILRGKPVFFANKKTKQYEKEVSQFLNTLDIDVFEGALEIELDFFMPRPKTVKRLNHIVKPDLSNLIKSFEDALQKCIIKGDQQIVSIKATKQYASNVESVGTNMIIYIAGSKNGRSMGDT